MEAFQASGQPFIESVYVQRAMNSELVETYGALILGVDAARSGDSTQLCLRQGRRAEKFYSYTDMTETRLCGIISTLIDDLGLDKVFIDAAHGYGTYDMLVARGYGSVVELVNFGGPSYEEAYLNKRAEMFFNLRDWLKTDVRIL